MVTDPAGLARGVVSFPHAHTMRRPCERGRHPATLPTRPLGRIHKTVERFGTRRSSMTSTPGHGAAITLETLEPRRLLSSYLFESLPDGLGIDPTPLDIAAAGAVSLASVGDVDRDGADDLLVG